MHTCVPTIPAALLTLSCPWDVVHALTNYLATHPAFHRWSLLFCSSGHKPESVLCVVKSLLMQGQGCYVVAGIPVSWV